VRSSRAFLAAARDIDILADPERLRQLDLTIIDD
jgi:hypothetical protein